MRIGILTRRDGYNFGTSLQAFALFKSIQKFHEDVTVIDYSEYSLKARVRYSFLDIIGHLQIPYLNAHKRYKQRKLFRHFDTKLKKTVDKFRYRIPNGWNDGFDRIICGSDQIWNPTQKTGAFMLDFVSDNTKKIAYAPSLGMPNCVNAFKMSDIKLMKQFSYLSCREMDGSQIISDLTGQPCVTVVDPTLLLSQSEWTDIESNIRISEPFLLTYFLGPKYNYPIEIITRIAEMYNLRILNVCLPHYDEMPGITNLRCSPEEFIYLIHNANLVCTNSYHGCVFSMIYNKLFYVFDRNYSIGGYSEKSRFYTLFKDTQLTAIPLSAKTIDDLPYDNIDLSLIHISEPTRP